MSQNTSISSTTQIIDLESAIAQSIHANQPVVLIVPGWKDTGRTTRFLHAFLKENGLPVVTCSPQPTDGSKLLTDLAKDIQPICTDIIKQTKLPIKLVGFSMGGLIIRSYLQELDGAKDCSHLVTISTPHLGSLMAFFTDQPGLKLMRPNGNWLQQLNADRSAFENIKVTSIWSPFDTAIVPPASSYFPGATNVRILSPAHNMIMRDPRIHEAVLAGLQR